MRARTSSSASSAPRGAESRRCFASSRGSSAHRAAPWSIADRPSPVPDASAAWSFRSIPCFPGGTSWTMSRWGSNSLVRPNASASNAPGNFWISWGCRPSRRRCRTNFRAACGSASRSRGRWRRSPTSCSWTSRSARSTRTRGSCCSGRCSGSARSGRTPSCS